MLDKVLVVDDESTIQDLAKNILKRFDLIALRAENLACARKLFLSHQDEILIILMDGAVESADLPDTLPLVEEFRRTFTRPIVAISGKEETNELLMQAGCSYSGTKPYFVDPILEAIRKARED